jgi:rhodanese-related sulfurtransferase
MDRMLFLICALFGSMTIGTAQNNGSAPQQGATSPTELDAMAFKDRIDRGGARLIDVRTPAEFATGHIAGAVNMDWTARDYEALFATLDPKQPVLLYCAAGGRSEQALEYLRGKGFRAAHLIDGIAAWNKAGLPVVKE